jgi:predicted nucleotidyltransferase
VTGILLPCRRCGRQVYSSEVRGGLCLDCRVDEALAELRAEHARLWRKRERYHAKKANADSISRQIARVQDRMAARIVALVPEEKAAAEHLERTLRKAREARYDIRSLRP